MSPRLIASVIGIALVAVLGAVFLGGPIIGFLKGQVKHWQAKEETAQDTAASKGAEATAATTLGQAQGQIAERVIERNTQTIRYIEKASGAPDAKAPLGVDRSSRIDGHTASLCQQRPAVCARGGGSEGDDAGVR